MSGPSWVRITGCDSLPAREGRAVVIGRRELALFRVEDRFLAVDGRCPHQGGPLCDGIVAGETVVCPLHAWKISLRTGAVERPASVSACVRSYPTKVEDGVVMVLLPPDAGTAAA